MLGEHRIASFFDEIVVLSSGLRQRKIIRVLKNAKLLRYCVAELPKLTGARDGAVTTRNAKLGFGKGLNVSEACSRTAALIGVLADEYLVKKPSQGLASAVEIGGGAAK